ncbi:hypothetical protein D3C86_1987770 [compost metagenome]
MLSPRTAARNASSSRRSGSFFGNANRVTSPSDTPRNVETDSHSSGTTPFAKSVRSPVAVSAMKVPRSPVTMVVRSFMGLSQLMR